MTHSLLRAVNCSSRPAPAARSAAAAAATITALLLTAASVGCTGSPGAWDGPPGLWERGWIESRDHTMVVARVTAEAEDGRTVPASKLLQLGLEDFESGGREQPLELDFARGLDAKSARDGWFFVLLKPGTRYLVAGRRRNEASIPTRAEFEPGSTGRVSVLRTRIDVPANVAAVYVGSLHVRVSAGTGGLHDMDDAGVTITDESEAAAKLVTEKVPWVDDPPQTALMTRYR